MHSHREQLARLSQVYLLGTENGQSGFLRHVGPAISGPEYLQSTDLSVLSTVKKLSGGLRYGFPELFGLRLRVFELENENIPKNMCVRVSALHVWLTEGVYPS